jgi:Ca2+-binding EF-hand superfamily protein
MGISKSIQLTAPLSPHASHLKGKRLTTIRNMYDAFKACSRATAFFVSKHEFRRILSSHQISRIDDIYYSFAHNSHETDSDANFMEFVTALVVYGEINWSAKVKFLFNMFDFDNSRTITLSEMTMMGSCFSKGICNMTRQKTPTMSELR